MWPKEGEAFVDIIGDLNEHSLFAMGTLNLLEAKEEEEEGHCLQLVSKGLFSGCSLSSSSSSSSTSFFRFLPISPPIASMRGEEAGGEFCALCVTSLNTDSGEEVVEEEEEDEVHVGLRMDCKAWVSRDKLVASTAGTLSVVVGGCEDGGGDETSACVCI